MYHRIADVANDPWELAVSPENFEDQLRVLKKKFRIISVSDLAKSLVKMKLPSNSVCITFDDGYRDNFYAAKPLLEKYKCPATFFIASQFIDGSQLFWWDELLTILLETEKLPATLSLELNNELFEYRLENNGVLTEEEIRSQKMWVWYNEPPTQRCRLYFALWERLRPLPFQQIAALISYLRSWASAAATIDSDSLPMTHNELKTLSANHLFTAGIHTVSHPALAFHTKEIQQEEIKNCHQFLQQICKNTINAIAYPYGNYNDDTIEF